MGHHQFLPIQVRGDDVIPLNFAVITGLRVRGELIPYDSGLVNDDAAFRWFLGRVPLHSGEMATYG